MGLKILNLNFIKFFHSLEILKISKKKLEDLANEFLKIKVSFDLLTLITVKLALKMFYLGIQTKLILEKNT